MFKEKNQDTMGAFEHYHIDYEEILEIKNDNINILEI